MAEQLSKLQVKKNETENDEILQNIRTSRSDDNFYEKYDDITNILIENGYKFSDDTLSTEERQKIFINIIENKKVAPWRLQHYFLELIARYDYDDNYPDLDYKHKWAPHLKRWKIDSKFFRQERLKGIIERQSQHRHILREIEEMGFHVK